ncbi:hypothetical protein BGZ51_000605 [Haplosporangium sp. Z 767]|nr:hypothetical protein BGZ50_003020 [Haplosporangium sp. Z 11]KAF9188440.1 hypothetical protein BGZ51_000605 [Haplosporangium sp. Z 767]
MSRTQILIAGAGLGGLAFAIMLERLPEEKKVDYLILERSTLSNPMGSAISLHASVIPLLKQLGIWQEIERASKPMSQFSIKREDGSDLGTVDFAYGQFEYGNTLGYSYYGMVLSRPDLHTILMGHVPPEKMLVGKRIVNTTQDDVGVSCHCADGSIYHGDILIGADGAYSAVRQSLYRNLRAHGNLPRQDFSPIKLDQVVVVGITEPLNPMDYPLLKEDVCQFRIVLGGHDRPYTMWMVPLSNNRIGWSIGGRSDALSGSSFWSESQDEATASFGDKAHQFSRFPDWGEAECDSIEEICEQMRTKRNPFGNGTYGDLIDKTPKHLISRVMFEEKGFRTWYGGRTVLIGDACHKAQVEEDGRVIMFNSVPRWLQRWTLDKTNRADPKLDFILSKMSRSPSLQSFTTILEKTSQFDADDLVLADRLSLKERNDQGEIESVQGESQESVDPDSTDEEKDYRGRSREVSHSVALE